MCNTSRDTNFCHTCTAPVLIPSNLCRGCEILSDKATQGGYSTADMVLPLSYANHNQQSKVLMYGYKGDLLPQSAEVPPPEELQHQVFLMLLIGAYAHRQCINKNSIPINSFSVVPSTSGKPNRPLPILARAIGIHLNVPEIPVTYEGSSGSPRDFRPDAYSVSAKLNARTHVLILDDTWVSGSRPQSVAAALREKGAERVSIMAASRWLDPNWGPSKS